MRLLRFQRKLDDEKGAGLLGLSLQVTTRGGAPWPADISLYLHLHALCSQSPSPGSTPGYFKEASVVAPL